MRRPPFFVAAEEDPLLRPQRADRGKRVAWLIVILSLSTTLLAWSLARRAADIASAVRFDTLRAQIVNAISSRMVTYEQVLRGGAGLLRASDLITFHEWRDYVASLDIEAHYPGILGIGYAAYVPQRRLKPFLDQLASQPMPRFTIRPPGEREIYVPVTYIEPFSWRNQRAFGYDMYQDPTRRAAIDQARDTGNAVLTAPVTLAQETERNVQPGVLMYVPVYRNRPTTIAQRRSTLLGFVYAPFRVHDLLDGILEPREDVRVVLYDGAGIDPANRIYDTLRNGTTGCVLDRHQALVIANHTWTVRVCALPAFERSADLTNQRLILGTGIIISLLLFGVAWAMASTRERALAIAHNMTRELREERQRLSEIAVTLGEGLFVLDSAGTITFCNPAAAHLLGWEPDELLNRKSEEVLSSEAIALGFGTSQHAFVHAESVHGRYVPEEATFRRRDGTTIPVSVVSTPILREGKLSGAVIAFQDTTERRRAEAALREGQQFAALFEYSSDALFLVNLEGEVIDANPVALENLGHAREELIGRRTDTFVRWSTVPTPGQSFSSFFDTVSEKTPVRGEAEYVRKDGTSFFVEAAYSLFLHENRKLILISARDITERKEAERRIQRALDELEHSRREVEEANERLAESNRELQRLSRRDSLTGIANRRNFEEYIDLEWSRAARDHRPLSLLMIDVDHFKAYNDRYGHQAGDECLRRIADAIDQQLSRSIDVVARYGGEEFVVVLPETPVTGAINIGERLRQAVEALQIEHDRSPASRVVTISVGAATVVPHPKHARDWLISAADGALYRAKQEGRNRVCAAEPPTET